MGITALDLHEFALTRNAQSAPIRMAARNWSKLHTEYGFPNYLCEQILHMASPDLGYRGLAIEGDDLLLLGLRFLPPAMLVQTLKHLAVLRMHKLSIQGVEAIPRSESTINRELGVYCKVTYVCIQRCTFSAQRHGKTTLEYCYSFASCL